MDLENLAGQIAGLVGVEPSTLVLLIMIVGTLANAGARLIPDDAVGFWGGVRRVCAVIGVYIPSRISPGVSVNDVARAALDTPPIPGKVEAEQAEKD